MAPLCRAWIVGAGLLFTACAGAAGDPKHGEYVARLGGCHSCHSDPNDKGSPLAGGLELKSPFGTFYVPNITPDADTGIGRWTAEEFVRAMTEGVAPDGRHYYPAFPFTSYARMTQKDLLDLKAYLDSLKSVRKAARPHDLQFPYNLRFGLRIWRWLYFRPAPFRADPAKSAGWNRGAYLVTGPGHCGECHTVRNFFGATSRKHALAGTKSGPDGNRVPNITPHRKDGIGLWSAEELVEFFRTGNLPFGETVDSPMEEVINSGTRHWTEADLRATAEYLLSLPERETP